VGLVEHFSVADTQRVIESHFAQPKPGGIAVISFPTPTLLYRAARFLTGELGMWNFPDERPLHRAEVASTLEKHGELFSEKLLWPLVFTQRIMVVRKFPQSVSNARAKR